VAESAEESPLRWLSGSSWRSSGPRPHARPRRRRDLSGLVSAICFLLLTLTIVPVAAHEGEHADPELLNHWRAQVHLLFQWAHLVAFALWVGGMLTAVRLPRLRLDRLLLGSWALFLVSLGTGSYNMQFSAAIPEPPDLLSLPGIGDRYEFGGAYIILVGVKQGLFALAALLTLSISVAHVRRPPEASREELRRVFVRGSVAIGLTVAAVTSMVLVLHEAVDLAPTPLHSLGGVVGPRGPDEMSGATLATRRAPPPYHGETRTLGAGFQLFTIPHAAADAAMRFGHLVGFALWLGGTAGLLLAPVDEAARALPVLWLGLITQALTGAYQIVWWTPFSVTPYPWQLSTMATFRFGFTYTLVLAVKLGLALVALLGTVALDMAARRASARPGGTRWVRGLGWLNVAIGLALAYAAITLLLVHEGVDHAL
jgi:hypothetical protein